MTLVSRAADSLTLYQSFLRLSRKPHALRGNSFPGLWLLLEIFPGEWHRVGTDGMGGNSRLRGPDVDIMSSITPPVHKRRVGRERERVICRYHPVTRLPTGLWFFSLLKHQRRHWAYSRTRDKSVGFRAPVPTEFACTAFRPGRGTSPPHSRATDDACHLYDPTMSDGAPRPNNR